MADDKLSGKVQVWRDPDRRSRKCRKDLSDILRFIEVHPKLEPTLPPDV
ncbi:MAG: hypothetical protein QF721_04370 [Verrucomicrobiota bacterium]|nr:hypothetical protein [Verrucomicrobiota bacterium]